MADDLIERLKATEGHTRGPWRIRRNRSHNPEECDLTICGDIFLLADVNGPNYSHCEPNAALIALAPEMKARILSDAAEIDRLHTALAAAEARAEKAERERDAAREALRVIANGDAPMPAATVYRADGQPSKHDRCKHEQWMYDGCSACIEEFAASSLAALTPARNEKED